jgi:lysophospholipase L1-like esterase
MTLVASLNRLSRVALVATGVPVWMQARRLRRDVPRLPDAALPWQGAHPGPDPLRLLVIGDSTAAGVGADTQDDALPGQLGRQLAALTGRGVDWRALGENGVDTAEFIARYLPEAEQQTWDVVFVSIGANDALGLRSRAAFVRDLSTILTRLRAASPDAALLVSSLPAFARFELLPDPLRWNLAVHSRSLEAGARRLVERTPGAHMSPPPPPYTPGFFASDLFHPSAQGYRDWARFAIEDAVMASALPFVAR